MLFFVSRVEFQNSCHTLFQRTYLHRRKNSPKFCSEFLFVRKQKLFSTTNGPIRHPFHSSFISFCGLIFFNRPIPAPFCLFSSFSHHNSITNWKKCRCCAWDKNPVVARWQALTYPLNFGALILSIEFFFEHLTF